MSDELPKQELLLKCLKMTTSDNDGEALAAMRRANALLVSAGWTWDKLIAAKIVVVGDPFASIAVPKNDTSDRGPMPFTPPSPRRTPAPPPRPTPPPPSPWYSPPDPLDDAVNRIARQRAADALRAAQAARQAPPKAASPYSSSKNNYAGWCWCCGNKVDIADGAIIKPSRWNPRAPSTKPNGNELWAIICTPCNNTRAFVPTTIASRQHPRPPSGPAPRLDNL